MATVLQKIISKIVVTLLIIICTAYAFVGFLIDVWKYKRIPKNSLFQIFRQKPRIRPKVLDLPEFRHKYVQLSQIQMHYVESGDVSKPLMLCLHGFPEFWYSYRFQLRYFSNDYHVVAPDLRGYGETEKPDGISNYDIDILTNDIAELIEKIGKRRAIVIGHDWGAALAWWLAMTQPELIANRLIILNGPHPLVFQTLVRTKSAQLWKSWYVFMMQCPIFPELYLRAMDFKFLELFRRKDGGLLNSFNFTDDDMEAWKYTFSYPNSFTPPLNYYRAVMKTASKRPKFNRIQPKTLIIWGEQDLALDFANAELPRKFLRDGHLERIPNASHWVQQDVPELVNTIIERFLKNHL